MTELAKPEVGAVQDATRELVLRAPNQTGLTEQAAQTTQRQPIWTEGLWAAAVWLASAAVTQFWPDITPWSRTALFAVIQALVALGLAAIALSAPQLAAPQLATQERQRASWLASVYEAIAPYGPWFGAFACVLTVWQVATAKTGVLPLPFFPPPQSVLEVYTDDASRLFESVWRSMALLLPGYLIGGLAGFFAGVSIGGFKTAHYWGHPILRFVGPLPATAWLPIAFFFFPSAHSASTFLIARSTAFPVAVLTSSGIGSVTKTYYDIARTLGADTQFLITRVAVPAALPHVFVGLFMGLGSSFAVLVVAEMMGVKAGLGWYLQWAQGWAAYANLYAALIVMALLFSGLISLLFLVRDYVLAWQKNIVRW